MSKPPHQRHSVALFRIVEVTRLLAVCVIGFAATNSIQADEATVDFEKHVAPLLIHRCLNCHDGGDAKGALDLSRHESAIAGGETGEPAISPGKPANSYLLDRVASGEMPPEGKGQPLTKEEVAIFRRWIEQGATWPANRELSPFEFTTDKRGGLDWWSLQAVVRPSVPAVKATTTNPIDAFVAVKLAENGLTRSPPADARTLVRRLYFDLVGLPPTPDEMEKWTARLGEPVDDAAYAELVNHLLASPNYGERWARHWLDVAHFADTHGFERDFRRDNAWPYRDYVIRAFNDDKPYDQFIREQIAGDVIAPQNADAVIATGFLAAGPWDFVGNKENKDPKFRRLARADDLDDLITTVMTATVGLTVNCARCHSHKFDPIPHEDYYRLWAVFSGVERGDRDVPQTTEYQQERQRYQEVLAQLNSLDGKALNLADVVGGGSGFGDGKPQHGVDPRNGKPVNRGEAFLGGVQENQYATVDYPLVDGVFIPNGGDDKTPVTISSTGLQVTDLPKTTGKVWDHVKLGPPLQAHRTKVDGIDYAVAPHTMLSLHANKGVTFDLAAVRKATDYRRLRFRTAVANGGAEGNYAAAVAVYVDGKRVWHQPNLTHGAGAVRIDIPLDTGARFLTLVATDAGNDISHDQVFFGDPLLVNDPDEATVDVKQQQRRAALTAERDALAEKLVQVEVKNDIKKVYAAISKKPEVIHVLSRGDTESPGEQVAPGALSAISQLEADLGSADTAEGQRRLALAEWIVSAKNPLTPRVIVNRLWHHHFGTGIVATPSDFGFLGGAASHPQLLDWLAAELIENGWSLKHIHRLIVTSQTYRQSGKFNAKAAEQDADNRLLWRASPRRLEAEAVRDAVLAMSGKLNPQRGGPGYQDFQFVERYAPIYRYITPDKPALWRRSVYRFTVRSVPNPLMEVLDCPNPSNFAPRRSETTTALQSLALSNAPFMTEQAGYFAERVKGEAGSSVSSQVRLAFQLSLSREPNEEELKAATAFVEQQSLFHFCRVLLNTNEFLYID